MIEVRMRHEHEIQLRELVGRERTVHQSQGPEAANPHVDADSGEQQRIGDDPDPIKVDQDGRVPKPGDRDGVVVPRRRCGLCGAIGTSRPNSPIRSRRKRAGQDEDKPTNAVVPTPATTPPATKVRRLSLRDCEATIPDYFGSRVPRYQGSEKGGEGGGGAGVRGGRKEGGGGGGEERGRGREGGEGGGGGPGSGQLTVSLCAI